MKPQAGWSITGSGGGNQTLTKAGVPGKQHIVYGIDIGVSTTNGATIFMEIKDGSTRVWAHILAGAAASARDVTFPAGIAITPGNAVSFVISATGGNNFFDMHGITRG